MIEDTNFKIGKICSMIKRLRESDIKYNRAQYRVSYYRKIKAAIIGKDPSIFLNRRNLKYRNNLKDLNQKIEKARLIALKQQKEQMAIKHKLQKPLNKAIKDIGASLAYEKGSIVGIYLNVGTIKQIPVGYQEILERAEQFEASLILNKLLAKK